MIYWTLFGSLQGRERQPERFVLPNVSAGSGCQAAEESIIVLADASVPPAWCPGASLNIGNQIPNAHTHKKIIKRISAVMAG